MEPLRSDRTVRKSPLHLHEFSLIEQKVIPLSPFEWEWKPLFDVYVRIHALEAGWHYVNGSLSVDGSSSLLWQMVCPKLVNEPNRKIEIKFVCDLVKTQTFPNRSLL